MAHHPALETVYTHHQCPHNARVGLTARHLLDNNPQPEWLEHTQNGTELLKKDAEVVPGWTQKAVIKEARAVVDEWVGRIGKVEPIALDTYVDKFGGYKRERLVKAINQAEVQGSLPRRLKAFVKCDKYDEVTAQTKPPRMIQYADPAVNAHLARYLAPAETAYLCGPGHGPSGTPDCSKGMDLRTRAETWQRKRLSFAHPVCLLGDFSKFDAHMHTHMLQLEHHLWKSATEVPSRYLDNQLINNVSFGGMHWTAVGTRMSGTYNTGGGNSVCNIIIMQTVARVAGVQIEILVDGDDSLVWMEQKDQQRFLAVASEVIGKVFGMKWGYETTVDPELEEYCHTALTTSPTGSAMCVTDPLRALTRAMCVVNKTGGRLLGRQLVSSLVGLYCGNPHHPVLSRVTWDVLQRLGAIALTGQVTAYCSPPEDLYLLEKWNKALAPHWHPDGTLRLNPAYMEVSEESRLAVQTAFGVSVNEQHYLETRFAEELVVNPTMKVDLRTPTRLYRAPVQELLACSDWTYPL